MLRLEFYHSTSRFCGERSNPLCHRHGSQTSDIANLIKDIKVGEMGCFDQSNDIPTHLWFSWTTYSLINRIPSRCLLVNKSKNQTRWEFFLRSTQNDESLLFYRQQSQIHLGRYHLLTESMKVNKHVNPNLRQRVARSDLVSSFNLPKTEKVKTVLNY